MGLHTVHRAHTLISKRNFSSIPGSFLDESGMWEKRVLTHVVEASS